MPTPEEIAAAAAAEAAAKGGDGKGGDGKGGDGKGSSALAAGQEKPETWIPEKFHVRKDGKKDGEIDVDASMRALAKSHGELTKRMVDVGLPPEDADKYEIGGEGSGIPKEFDVAEFRKDPQMADFLKGAHSLGMTNKQVNYVINRYLAVAPELAGAAAELSNEECVAQLALVWKSDAEMASNLKASHVAATRLAEASGLKYDDIDAAFGNNPVFIRLMAGLAKQMGEDTPPNDQDAGGDRNGADFDSQVAALRKQLDEIPERNTKERDAVLTKLDELYNKRYGKSQRAPLFVRGAAGGKAA
jgi:hypothetical protein